ncbi:MAG: hypothetical protein J7513_11175 [Solirubrobacteraceae bacterium]|nr:hypothetical protein [Solirubrobacteraceae bacterium]
MSRPAQRARALLRALALAVAVMAAAGSGTALASTGDLVVVDAPGPVLPDDSAKPLEAAMSGNGRYVAIPESRDCTSLVPSYEYFYDCYPEQHIWRYDLQTGARVKVDKGGPQTGGARQPVLSSDGSVAAWTAFYWFPDGDVNYVFRSRPDTGQAGTNTIPYAGNQGPDGEWYPEFIYQPSISSDGTTLAMFGNYYGGDCAFRAFLWSSSFAPAATPIVKPLATGCADYELPGQVAGSGLRAKVSGDGKTIVFASEAGLYRYDVTTGSASLIPLPAGVPTDESGSPWVGAFALSADASTLAFLAPDSVNNEGTEQGLALWTSNLATGVGTRVATITDDEVIYNSRLYIQPAISADGRFVAFNWQQNPVTGADDGNIATYRYDRANASIKRVSQTTGGTRIPLLDNAISSKPQISADGRYVTFIANDAKQAVPDDATPTGPHVIRADVDGPTGDTTAPAKPASIKVSQGSVGAQLTWPAVTDPSGPVLYRIRQRPIAGGTSALVGTKAQTTTSLTLRGLAAGKPYRFAITAEDAQGNRSTATTVSFTAAGTADPTPPTITAPEKPYVGTAEQQLGGPFTINGGDLANVSTVLIGGQPATGLTITPTKITGTAPRSGDAASVPVTVIGPFGAKAAGRFYYRQPGTTETGD